MAGEEFAGRTVLILGLGRFGGGGGALRFLASRGARVRITDLRSREQLAPTLEALSGLEFESRLGGHPPSVLDGVDLVVVNPAVPPSAPIRREIRRRGIPETSELGLFLERCPAPVTAVSGTNGKSTTTALTAAALEAAGFRVHLGGNLGGSLLPAVHRISPEDRVVLEVSSFQADLLPEGPWFRVLAFTYVGVDHLDRYGTPRAYQESKKRMLRLLAPGGILLVSREDPVSRSWDPPEGIRKATYGQDPPRAGHLGLRDGMLVSALTGGEEPLLGAEEIPLPGSFQVKNVLAAAGAALLSGGSPAALARAVRSFPGLDHRLQPLGRIGPVLVVDNGVSTAPETTLSALEALEESPRFSGPIHLVCGGKSKGAPLEDFASALAAKAATVHLFGKAGPDLAVRLEGRMPPGGTTLSQAMEDALDQALASAREGGILLFSPAFSSFDAYLNFQDRARAFRRWAASRGLTRP